MVTVDPGVDRPGDREAGKHRPRRRDPEVGRSRRPAPLTIGHGGDLGPGLEQQPA